MDIILYIIAGAAVGMAVGLTGVGGGSLMTPLLILFGFPYNVAIGTDLLYAAITKSGGVVAHRRAGNIRWDLVWWLAAGSIPAAVATAALLKTVFGGAEDYKTLLTTSLGIMLILTSAVLLFKNRIKARCQSAPEPRWIDRHAKAVTLVSGVLLGVFVTLSSVGAGAFCAALLLVLYPHLPALKVVGTDIAHAVPLTFIAGLGHLALGNVDFMLLGCLLIGSLPAIHFGTRLGSKLPNQVLQPILATLLMMLGVKFAFF
ncbi:sulfite exporter TauE/SafE family protein [Exilibacterium tricleocarpae]|uniref:Probable membrane transporter protein n=1 Tax=Exilibacterium tricleocarpae TaxID=2591008 RepID=A0A545T8G7_9GAMM|nr:sulfite exporter TauE/SafE family protein [Exilibacterium tricleocarpae]TQV73520.1 sulfite exporter TauE/SafE family protein [Exilibacterium tricleocarpae]